MVKAYIKKIRKRAITAILAICLSFSIIAVTPNRAEAATTSPTITNQQYMQLGYSSGALTKTEAGYFTWKTAGGAVYYGTYQNGSIKGAVVYKFTATDAFEAVQFHVYSYSYVWNRDMKVVLLDHEVDDATLISWFTNLNNCTGTKTVYCTGNDYNNTSPQRKVKFEEFHEAGTYYMYILPNTWSTENNTRNWGIIYAGTDTNYDYSRFNAITGTAYYTVTYKAGTGGTIVNSGASQYITQTTTTNPQITNQKWRTIVIDPVNRTQYGSGYTTDWTTEAHNTYTGYYNDSFMYFVGFKFTATEAFDAFTIHINTGQNVWTKNIRVSPLYTSEVSMNQIYSWATNPSSGLSNYTVITATGDGYSNSTGRTDCKIVGTHPAGTYYVYLVPNTITGIEGAQGIRCQTSGTHENSCVSAIEGHQTSQQVLNPNYGGVSTITQKVYPKSSNNKTTAVTAVANEGYFCRRWSISDGTTNSNYTIPAFTPTEDVTYTAEFRFFRYQIITLTDTGAVTTAYGSTTDSAGNSVSAKQTKAGSTRTDFTRATATPAAGYRFVEWRSNRNVSNNGTRIVTPNTISTENKLPDTVTLFTDNADITMYAVFEAYPVLSEISKDIGLGDGTVLPGVEISTAGGFTGAGGTTVEFPNGYVLTESALNTGTASEDISLGYEKTFTYSNSTVMISRQEIGEVDTNGDPVEVERTTVSVEYNDVATLIVFRDGKPYVQAPTGTVLTYNIHVKNTGTAKSPLLVVDTLPTGMTYNDGTATPTTGNYYVRREPNTNGEYVAGSATAAPGFGRYVIKAEGGAETGFAPLDYESPADMQGYTFVMESTTGNSNHPSIFRYIQAGGGSNAAKYTPYGSATAVVAGKNTLVWDTVINPNQEIVFSFNVTIG